MKRSKNIHLDLMRKVSVPRLHLRPLAIGVAAAIMSGCSDGEQVKMVKSPEDCASSTELNLEQCEAAYKKALAEAERTGPKYSSMRSCEAEFGAGQCTQLGSSSTFMPLMAGFLVGQALSNRNESYYGSYNPVYRYSRPYSSFNNRIMMADGTVIGDHGEQSYSVSKSNLKPKPSVTRTVSRGGFGSVASAKSSWGGGRSGGWGG
jgi:uncharacterized protein YgiB involved in biofilm formation